ncbi:MAG TPA: 3-dehydroquinate synthase [Roseiflexaceae bacterium]|nr:3-dehydroquinate synthase [Roseiflexaceae bacterium]
MHYETLRVTTPGGAYPVLIGPDLLTHAADQLRASGTFRTAWLISDSHVFDLYGAPLLARLQAAGFSVRHYTVAAGETSKDLAVAGELYDWLIGGGVERSDLVLALGGGVIGDLAGFVAATTLRGIPIIQLPTNLQAMIDSAIGGKTGVNHRLGKNLIGAFHQPRLVLCDTTTLATVPLRELRAGWAEVVKHGVIRDAGLFMQLEALDAGGHPPPEPARSTLLRRAVAVKVDVVNIDERETGERMLLNYGHTLGHAIEAAAGYGSLLHGEAIAIGMHLEACIAEHLGMVDTAFVARQQQLLQHLGLATDRPAHLTADDLLARTLRDKKVRAGRVRWALPTGLGSAVIRDDVPEALVRAVLG